MQSGGGADQRINGGIKQSWKSFWSIKENPKHTNYFELHYVTEVTMYMNIIRIDERMWVSPYLSSQRGGGSPIYEITGEKTPLFEIFQKEFDHIWEHSIKVKDEDWQAFIK